MKKTVQLLFVLAMVASLGACSSDEPKKNTLESLTFKEANYTIEETFCDLNLRKELVGTPAGIIDTCKINWTVSDTGIADIDGSYLIPKSPGTVKITAKAQSTEATCTVTVKEVDINSITLDDITVPLNGSKQLTFTTDPANISITRFTLTSDNKNVATVDPDGTVHGFMEGSATIKAVHEDVTSTCTVTVKKNPVTKIVLSEESYRFYQAGETHKLTATVYPEDASYTSLTWTTSASSVVKVDQDGNISSLKYDNGTATTITASVDGVKATCSVRVSPQQSTSIKLNYSTYTFAKEGDTFTLKITDIQPETRTLVDNFKWTTGNSSVALVNSTSSVEGNILSVTVKCVGVGSTTITCRDTWSGVSASCNVNLPKIPVTNISLNRTTISLTSEGATETITATLTPSNTTTKSVTWSSNNNSIASVTANGLSCTIKAGSSSGLATITASADGQTASCTVWVRITGTVKDSENNSYNTVKISGKWWLAEDLRTVKDAILNELGLNAKEGYTTRTPTSTGIKTYYYNYKAAQYICPDGWRIPTTSEYESLTNYAVDVTKWQALKSTSGWATRGNNIFGFNALPSGFIRVSSAAPAYSTKEFVSDGDKVYFWASDGYYTIENDKVKATKEKPETHAFNVRCVKK